MKKDDDFYLKLAKKKFLEDWNEPHCFDHEQKMKGPEYHFKKLKKAYLEEVKIKYNRKD